MDTKAVLDAKEREGLTQESLSPLVAGLLVAATGAVVLGALAAVAVSVFGWYELPSSPAAVKALAGPSLGEVLLQDVQVARPPMR